ncbi:MAG: glycoside hydrolase family 78 protein [Anaerolineales bacterium]|nr:glycoside hydrolase family 78 protein [Anaerolineales bacterium]
MLTVTGLTCEYLTNPLGLDTPRPRLAWQITTDRRGTRQSAYQISATSAGAALWDSGRVETAQSTQVEYGGPPLAARQRVRWQVRVWDEAGAASEWSEAATWELGLLGEAGWTAAYITPEPAVAAPCPLVRGSFEVSGPVAHARVYATALGLYALELNGAPVSDWLFTPGWTAYNFRRQYQTFDITARLRAGRNVLGATLAEGWYRGRVGGSKSAPGYKGPLALRAQVVITYADGRVQVVGTDETWQAATGPTVLSDIYDGETYDARLERPGWSTPEYAAEGWQPVRVVSEPQPPLVGQDNLPVRRQEVLRPVKIWPNPAGEGTLVDFGQNLVGWLRLRVRGPAGATITIRHAEVLDQQGHFYLANIREALQTLTYTLKGEGEEVYEPQFTFMGFRYAWVRGWPGDLTADDLLAVVVHSDLPVTGSFTCSHLLLNQLQHNIVWGQKSNFLDVPTDCPQRDERLGWTGDAQVFLPTAAFNMDVAAFFTKWLRDLAADQYPDGSVPFCVPDVGRGAGATGWGDAAVIGPWRLYELYGDVRILAEQFASMAAWVDFIRAQTGARLVWDNGFSFGDWLAVEAPDPQFPNPVTDVPLIATAYFAHSAGLMAQAARVLGRAADAERYAALAAGARAAFNHEFVTPSGRVGPNSQTAYVLALHFGLLPPAQVAQAARRLADDIRRRGNHLSTGFIGTALLCHVLSDHGYTDVAYALLEQETYPSWLYAVKLGATTSWERWDNIKPDGSFQSPHANSFNHYSFGAIGDWMYRVIAGLNPAAPGYARLLFRPRPGGSLTHARAEHRTPYGPAASGWRRIPAGLVVSVTLPPNTTGEVRLPVADPAAVTEGGQPLAQAAGVTAVRAEAGEVVVVVGAGSYEFMVPAA